MTDHNSSRKIIILTEGHSDPINAKTAVSMLRYRAGEIVALLDSTNVGKTTADLFDLAIADVPVIGDVSEAPDADTLLIGIATSGGIIPESWQSIILSAIEAGMNIVSGMHQFLADNPKLANAAAEHGVQLVDIRKNDEHDCATRQGIRDDCLRIQTVGNDCCVGKMVAAIELTNALNATGNDAKFVATGQTGIMIAGDGCPIDCVVSDFVNGAAEKLVLKNQQHDILLIEGQGSLAHPKYSAVTLGLLHGCAPQGLIMCYEVGRTKFHHMEFMPLHPLDHLIEVYETIGSLMQTTKVIGVAMNSRRVSAREADAERLLIEETLGLPACDVFRHGSEILTDAVLNYRKELKL